MDTEFAGEIALEQRERQEQEGPLAELAPEPQPALPAVAPDPARPRGRPWIKGQSGNPAGRPPGIHPPAAVAEYIIGRKTIPLAKRQGPTARPARRGRRRGGERRDQARAGGGAGPPRQHGHEHALSEAGGSGSSPRRTPHLPSPPVGERDA
jgi:hypothetical protein